jgi:hypothetical protein
MNNNVDEVTVITSNHSSRKTHRPLLVVTAHAIFGNPMLQYLNALTIAANEAIADTGTTAIFIMDDAEVNNKHVVEKPLKIKLPNGTTIWSIHVCDINILGLPMKLTGHIVPSLKIASLIEIQPLYKVGCKVVFDNKKCKVIYNNKVILTGSKDPYTDL